MSGSFATTIHLLDIPEILVAFQGQQRFVHQPNNGSLKQFIR